MIPLNLFVPTFDYPDSYGRLATELSDALVQAGYYVNEFSLSGDARRRDLRLTFGGLVLGVPTNYHKFPFLAAQGTRIAVTMFESSLLPPLWAENLNLCNTVIVPADFLRDVFQASGVIVPVVSIPIGITPTFHQYKAREWTVTSEHPFTFLCIADRGLRKNWYAAAMAFNRAFGDDPRYRLIIKARDGVVKYLISNPNIEVVSQDMSDAEMCQLYHRAHVMIFPTRGEGFGLPPREFVATGGLALATHWGGTAQDIAQWGLPLPYSMEPAYRTKEQWAGKCGEWAVPDVDALTEIVWDVAAHYDTYMTQAPDRAKFVRETYTWSRFATETGAIYERFRSRSIEVPPASGG